MQDDEEMTVLVLSMSTSLFNIMMILRLIVMFASMAMLSTQDGKKNWNIMAFGNVELT